MKTLFGIFIAGLFVAGAFAGCVGSDETADAGELTLLAKAGDGEWTNETVVSLISEVITDADMDNPSARTKTVQETSFKLEGVSEGTEVVWDFGDLTTETAGVEATHTYTAPGAYFVLATVGGSDANITVAVNYHSSGSGSVFMHPGITEYAYEEGTSYFDYVFTVGEGAKKCEIDLVGSPEVPEAADIDLYLYDPTGKEIASATTEEVNEHITAKKIKGAGDYTCRIGQYCSGTDACCVA
ncbi:MAG: hypothetical protein CVT48_05465 [Thermoplasmata archaeon HGW-Thermoplasmata-1]|nr:MAG: hypothetical protein CVT48_05465 [Thermoplasmata archaeon HGW-Thermoplasmata-1]